eukprot:gene7515-5299_t
MRIPKFQATFRILIDADVSGSPAWMENRSNNIRAFLRSNGRIHNPFKQTLQKNNKSFYCQRSSSGAVALLSSKETSPVIAVRRFFLCFFFCLIGSYKKERGRETLRYSCTDTVEPSRFGLC